MSDYHEPFENLPSSVRDEHRALVSLKEEIEAIDWYSQRVALCENEELKQVLAHNRDEEIEHACMTLEWLRRNMPGWDEQLRGYLFKDTPITKLETGADETSNATDAPSASLNIGSLKGK